MSNYTGAVPETKRKPDWRDKATCRGNENDAWFPQPGDTTAVRDAKSGCFGCPVMFQCAQYALRTGQDAGVWGGLSEGQRTTLQKKHRRTEFDELGTVRTAVLAALHEELNPTRTLRDLWDDRTRSLPGGHIGWTGDSGSFSFHGHVYTPKQLSFVIDRGHKAVGIVRRIPECSVVECVNPRHLADNAERFQRKQAEERAAGQAEARAQYATEELAS